MRRHLPDHIVRPQVALGHAAQVGDRDRVNLATLSEGRLKAGQGEEEILPVVPRAAPCILDDLPHGHVEPHETAGAADVQDEGVPRLRLDGGRQLPVDDRLRRPEAGAVPRRAVRADEPAKIVRWVEPDQGRGGIEEARRRVNHGTAELESWRESDDIGHVREVRLKVRPDLFGKRDS